MKNEFQIFISYARPDREEAIELFHWLSSEGYNVWIDCNKLLPGQNWDFEIQRALEKSALILFLWSKNSRDRRGYIQKELNLALEKRKEKLIDDTYLIPIVLDDESELPSQLQPIQSVSKSDPVFSSVLLQTINNQLDRLGFERTDKQKNQDVHWSSKVKKETWDGLPGYEIEYQLFNFDSNIYLSASEIGKYIEGDLLKHLFEHRSQKLNQSPDFFNYAQDKWRRTNTLDAHANDPILKGRVLSLQYAVHWYGAGAAHPNYHFQTYSFILEPLFLVSSLAQIFAEPDTALRELQIEVRRQLLQEKIDDAGTTLDEEWVMRGTEGWKDFNSFVFGEQGIELLFAPYSVAAYAYGAFTAEVPYDRLVNLIHREYATALQIEYITRISQKNT